jgi:hypothetical protein
MIEVIPWKSCLIPRITRDSRKVLSRHYNELSEAFNNSIEKESLEVEFKENMNDFVVRAGGTVAIPSTSQGN